MVSYKVIGQPSPRADGPEKATGAALYASDVQLPGTLFGKVLRSPFPHARIVRVDTSRAEALVGVHAVVTGEDVKGVLYGRRLRDVPALAWDRARFVGDPVAAVAAEDADIAQQALNLIDVEYEEVPAVLDPLEAMRDDAPLIHPDVNDYVGLPEPLEKPSNVFVRTVWEKGDVEQGFAQADMIVEGTYTTQMVHQAYLESHSCLVWIDDDDRVQVWSSNKSPFALRQQLSDALGIPLERIRLNHAYIGGDFGGKGSPLNVPVCYFLALKSGRPVRMALDYVEEFMAANPRHPSIIRLKTGVMRDGTLVAQQSEVIFNSGAYGGFKPGVNLGGAARVAGPYRIPHVYTTAVQVYTNTVPGGHMRGPGEPQAVFAGESHMDAIARQMGIDPLELRMKNLIEDDDETPTSATYKEVKGKETLNAAIEAAGYRSPKAANVGRGMALGDRGPGGGESHAAITLSADGGVVLNTPIFEQGSGTYTTLRQIVAEELSLPADRVSIQVWDTDQVPFDTGVGGSRVTRIAGHVAYLASQETKQQMARLAAELLGWPEEQITLSGEQVSNQDTGESRPWTELLEWAGHSVTGQAVHADRERSPVTSFTAQVAEVSVDTETGEVKLLSFTTAHDVGKVLNPIGHQGQIAGGVMQGIGYAMMEDLRVEDGRVTALSFGDYKIPTMMDIPELRTVLLESESGMGPYKTKGIGENPIGPVAAAIANAVEDAVGVRIRDLPVTAEKVYRALKGR